jgi:WD40 repeat protein
MSQPVRPLKEPTLRKSFTIQKQNALCACPYGESEYLATGLSNGTVMLLPTQPQNKVRKWIGHRSSVTCIASCLSQPYLATGSTDCTVRLWVGNEEGDSMALEISDQEIVSLALSSRYDKLLVVDSSGHPTLWDPGRCSKLCDLQSDTFSVNNVSLSSDGLFALTGSASGEFRLYDIRSGDVTYNQHLEDAVTATAIRQTGQAIAVGLANGVVLLWDTRTQETLNNSLLHREQVTSLDFHPSKPLLISASDDRAITVCDAETRNLLYTLQCHTAGVRGVRWSVDGAAFSSVGADNRVVLWDEPVVDYAMPQPAVVDRTKPRSPTHQKLDKFNKPKPRTPPPSPDPEVAITPLVEEDQMKRYVMQMHRLTDQIASLSKTLSKIEGRMNAMDEQIAVLEIEKRKQAKRVLQNRKI